MVPKPYHLTSHFASDLAEAPLLLLNFLHLSPPLLLPLLLFLLLALF